jgi:hypothetical protein
MSSMFMGADLRHCQEGTRDNITGILPLRIESRICNSKHFLPADTHDLHWTTFAWVEYCASSGRCAMLAEAYGIRQVVLDEEPWGEGYDLGKFVFPQPFSPRQSNVELFCFLP